MQINNVRHHGRIRRAAALTLALSIAAVTAAHMINRIKKKKNNK
jgi:hypothetical protein